MAREGPSLLGGRTQGLVENDVLPAYLPNQPWQREPIEARQHISLIDAVRIDDGAEPIGFLAVAQVQPHRAQRSSNLFLPLALAELGDGEPNNALWRAAVARTRTGPREGLLVDGLAVERFVRVLLDDVRLGRNRVSMRGTVVSSGTPRLAMLTLPRTPDVRALEVEQTNSSVIVGESVFVKAFRHPADGTEPELEICRFLDAAGYQNVPPLLGSIEYAPYDGAPRTLCLLQNFVESQGDGWGAVLNYLDRSFQGRATRQGQDGEAGDEHAIFMERVKILGRRLADLHRAFATPTGDRDFDPEPVTDADVERWLAQARNVTVGALDHLDGALDRVPAALAREARALLERRDEVLARIEALRGIRIDGTKTRYHGDLHLGKVLVVAEDVLFVGFAGNYGDPLAMRRAKSSPLRDIARMMRSFNYAAVASVRGLTMDRSEDVTALEPLARDWERRSLDSFLAAYRESIAGCSSYPSREGDAKRLLDLFVLENAFYEMDYELTNRPSWVRIPLEGFGAHPGPAGNGGEHALTADAVLGDIDLHLFAEGTHRGFSAKLGAHPRDGRRRRRRAVRGVGAERAARRGRWRLQRLGRPPPPDALTRRRRRLGALHPRRRAWRAL